VRRRGANSVNICQKGSVSIGKENLEEDTHSKSELSIKREALAAIVVAGGREKGRTKRRLLLDFYGGRKTIVFVRMKTDDSR